MLEIETGFKNFTDSNLIHIKETNFSFKEFLIISLIVFLEIFAIISIFCFALNIIFVWLKQF